MQDLFPDNFPLLNRIFLHYLNAYFHYNPPTKLVATKDFAFLISDKGGLQNMRDVNLNVEKLKNDLKAYKNDNIDIQNGKVIVC